MKPSPDKPAAPQKAGDVRAEPWPPGSTLQDKRRVRRILRELSLLKLLKHTNRRVARLHALAVRCWRAVRAKGPPCLQPAPAGERSPLPEPEGDAADSPVGDADRTADAAMDPAAGAPPGDPRPGAGRRVAEEAERGLLEALPQRVYMPAPKVLCRPSAQRWVKPCCTRSCGDSLEHALATRYPQ